MPPHAPPTAQMRCLSRSRRATASARAAAVAVHAHSPPGRGEAVFVRWAVLHVVSHSSSLASERRWLPQGAVALKGPRRRALFLTKTDRAPVMPSSPLLSPCLRHTRPLALFLPLSARRHPPRWLLSPGRKDAMPWSSVGPFDRVPSVALWRLSVHPVRTCPGRMCGRSSRPTVTRVGSPPWTLRRQGSRGRSRRIRRPRRGWRRSYPASMRGARPRLPGR